LEYNKEQQQQKTTMENSLNLKSMFEHEMARAKESEEYNKRAPIPCRPHPHPHLDRSTIMRLAKEEKDEFSAKGKIKMRNSWITGLWL
jgi:hypothetical protein